MRKTFVKLLIAALAASVLLAGAGCSNQNLGEEQNSQQASSVSGQSTVSDNASSQGSAASSVISEGSNGEGSNAEKEDSNNVSDHPVSTPDQSSAAVSTPSLPEDEIRAQAAGDWTISEYGTIINISLKSDGSVMMVTNMSSDTYPGTWEVKNGQVVIHVINTDQVMELKDDKLYGTGEKAEVYFSRGTTDFSDVSEPTSSQSSTDVSDDGDSLEFGGHVDTQYVGDWKFRIDTSMFEEYGLDTSEIQDYLDELEKSVISLKTDGTVTGTYAGQSTDGVWESQGNIVNIFFDGVKQKFTYQNGCLESGDGFQLVKS